MRGNKSPAPPVLSAPEGRGIKPQKGYALNEELVIIEYYVKDKDYPPITFSFDDFRDLLHKNIGKYNYNNALLLYSIFETEQENGSELKNIIAYADYANHAIMTYDEFNNGVKCLLKMGLIKENDKKLFVNKIFKEWYDNKYKNNKRINIYATIENIQKYLDDKIKDSILNKNIETRINKIDFENSVNEYIKK